MKKVLVGVGAGLLVAAVGLHANEGASDAKAFDPAVSALDEAGFKPSMKSVDDKSQAYSKILRMPPGVSGSYMGVWKAPPGSYRSAGARAEVFVVLEGRGKIWLEGYGEHELEPGVVITTPANTPAVLTVIEPVRKVSWVDVSKCPITDKTPRTDC